MTPVIDRLNVLLRQRAYREGEFVLASGRTASFYLDAKLVTYSAEGAALVGEAVFEILRQHDVQAVGGLTMGADPIVAATIAHSFRAGAPLEGFVVRKEPKGHGTQKWIEGPDPTGKRVAVVDDVITTAGSALKAVDILVNKYQCKVGVLVGLIDRLEGGRENVELMGYPFRSVTNIQDIKAAACT